MVWTFQRSGGKGNESNGKRASIDARARARQSVRLAQSKFSEARDEARREALNEFARAELGEVEKMGKGAKLEATVENSWFQMPEMPWSPRKSQTIPKELALYDGTTATWQAIADKARQDVQDAVHDEQGWSALEKVFWLSDSVQSQFKVSGQENRALHGLQQVRVKASLVQIPPRVMLLLQIRGQLRGKVDPNLLYWREHYSFRFGQTFIVHEISAPANKLCSPRDLCDLVSWEERPDGSILIAQTSIANCLPQKKTKGCVRAVTQLRGMLIEPAETTVTGLFGGVTVVKSCKVTMVSCVDPKGWMLKSLHNGVQASQLGNFISNCENVGKQIVKSGEADKLIRSCIDREDL